MTEKEKLIELFVESATMDYKDSAEYFIANGVTFQKWIPVSERLPDSQGTYLCRYGFGQFADYMITGCIDWIAFDKHPHWQHASTGLFVTHWMPLPEPPKEDAK